MTSAPMKKPQPKPRKVIKVHLAQQIVEAFEGEKKAFQFECVTGDKDHPTDRGSFVILRKHASYRMSGL